MGLICAVLVVATREGRSQVSFTDSVYHQQTASGRYGDNIATGDVNGDGLLDVAVVDPLWDLKGRGWILLGPDWEQEIPITIPDAAEGDFIGNLDKGWFLADVTGDGLDDLLIGAPNSFAGATELGVGRALIALAPDFGTMIELRNTAPEPFSGFGAAMVVHDFTGDGVVDVAVSTPAATGPFGDPQTGRIDVYSGTAPQSLPVLTLVPDPPHFLRGWGSTLHVLDHDHDGVLDLYTTDRLVVAGGHGYSWVEGMDPSALSTWSYGGLSLNSPILNVRVVDLDLDGELDHVSAEINTSPDQILIAYGPDYSNPLVLEAPEEDTTTYFGRGLDVGDVDRDGYPDLVVGLPDLDIEGGKSTGRVTIYFGPDFVATQHFDGAHPHANFGVGIHLRDLDGDGFAEMFVGAGTEFGGRLHLFDHHTLRLTGATELSLSSGGTAELSIEAGPLSGGDFYLLMLGASGQAPGVVLPSAGGPVAVPLEPDALTLSVLAQLASPVFQGFVGFTDAEGTATAALVLP
ncbi:MAG TPA: FG-GAP repeat protein, partial [Planctomycetota bacterium]|nr:FG-GAP repeat protein [Planctomycetota bacterium]